MTERIYEPIDIKRSFVATEPEVKEVSRKDGRKADVLEFRILQPFYELKPGGTIERQETKAYDVKLFGEDARHVGSLLQKGMYVNVAGAWYTEHWIGRDGSEKQSNVVLASMVSLNLNQRRIKMIVFDRQAQRFKSTEEAKAQPPKDSPEKQSMAPHFRSREAVLER